jgi:hypothetical protein
VLLAAGIRQRKFWIVWPICSLIIAVGRLRRRDLAEADRGRGHAADHHRDHLVRQPLLRRGEPGCPYLPDFWRDIGPYLPPRNGYILLHHTIYFNGHGTTQALTVLLIYLGVAAAILIVLDLRRS